MDTQKIFKTFDLKMLWNKEITYKIILNKSDITVKLPNFWIESKSSEAYRIENVEKNPLNEFCRSTEQIIRLQEKNFSSK